MGLTLMAGCGAEGPQGARLWQEHCARCHGPQGEGTAAYNQYAAGINLRDDDWQYGGEDDTLVQTVRQGVFPVMPAFEGTLTEAQIREIVRHIRSLRGD
jgi:cytochrome c oxidase cbb3-type subunit 3